MRIMTLPKETHADRRAMTGMSRLPAGGEGFIDFCIDEGVVRDGGAGEIDGGCGVVLAGGHSSLSASD